MSELVPREISRKLDDMEIRGSFVMDEATLTVFSIYGERSVQLGPYESALAKALLVLSELYQESVRNQGS